MALSRWTDDRLDDLAADVRRLERIPERMVVLEQQVGALERATRDTTATLADLSRSLERRAEERAAERKADRRWMVGTMLTSAGLVIAAFGIIAERL